MMATLDWNNVSTILLTSKSTTTVLCIYIRMHYSGDPVCCNLVSFSFPGENAVQIITMVSIRPIVIGVVDDGVR